MVGRPRKKAAPKRSIKIIEVEGELLRYNDTYDPKFNDKIIQIGADGGGVAAMCKAVGVRTKQSFYDWCEKYPAFAEAYETAKIHCQVFLEENLVRIGTGQQQGNVTALAMLLNNKFPDDYKRSATGSTNTTEINIGSVNSVDIDPKALDERIANLQKKLGLLPKEEPIDEESAD